MARVVRVEDMSAHVGETVELRGWLAARRSSGKIHFLQVRDGSGTIQCVMGKNDVPAEVFTRADHLPQETALVVTGTVRADARSPIGVELGVSHLEVVHAPNAEFPIAPKDHGTGFLMEHRHLWLRSSRQHAILWIRAEAGRSRLRHGLRTEDRRRPAGAGAARPACARGLPRRHRREGGGLT